MFKRIGQKLIFAVGVASIIIIGIYAYVNIHSQSEVLYGEIERHAKQLSETVKKSTRFEMLYNRREHIHNMISTIGEEPCIRRVRVVDKRGIIAYSAASDEIGNKLDIESKSCATCHGQDNGEPSLTAQTKIFRMFPDSARLFGIITPILNEESCWTADCHAHPKEQKVLGTLEIDVCLRGIDREITRSEITTLAFAIISIISLSLIIAFFARRFIVKPVNNLVSATNKVAAGNLTHQVQLKGSEELMQLAASFNNMTKKLSEARMQLFQSDKMASLGRLAAGVAHEINNPLTGVLTYSSFLLKRTENQPDLHNDLKVIVRETKRSREIVKSLLDFARQSVPKRNLADINEIIENSIEVIKNQLSMNHVGVDKELADPLPELRLDSNQLQQVFINLLVNACDAIGNKGGRIIIRTYSSNLSPFGNIPVKNAVCPKGHDLMDKELKIDGLPSIKLKARSGNNEGFIYLDPVYGLDRHRFGIEIKDGEETRFSCSSCDISLNVKDKKCPVCNSAIYSVEVPGKGHLEGCSQKGCSWQKWDAIEVEGEQKFVMIEIEDNGSGIPQENLDKIFEPFFTTKGQKGTGLGLAVIWGIIDNHDGSIKVESEIDKGSKFIIKLPVKSNG